MTKHIEDQHQTALFSWAKLINIRLENGSVIKLIDALYAIPNGGKRGLREAVRLKAQGVKAGVSDAHLPISSNKYHGLWIELKKPKVKGQKSPPKVSDSQKIWLETMKNLGHKVLVAYGFDEAREAIKEYLGPMIIQKNRGKK